MQIIKKVVLALIIYLGVAAVACAETSLWQVQRGESVTYIAGTCHVLRSSDYPLPAEFARAYDDADVLVFETRLDNLHSPETQAMIVKKGVYPKGTGLDKTLTPRTYRVLETYCETLGVPVASLNRFKPSVVVLILIGLELQRLGVSDGVDNHFFQRASREGKKTEALESVDEHIAFILSMGKGRENDFIEHSIKDLKKTADIIDTLINAWRQGREDELYDLFVAEMKTAYPDLYKILLVNRNRAWLPKIERFVDTPEKELVLVGVGHLVGQEGIINTLRGRGYSIKKVTAN
jgi:uncharacterized protein YbaP (TraB family)